MLIVGTPVKHDKQKEDEYGYADNDFLELCLAALKLHLRLLKPLGVYGCV